MARWFRFVVLTVACSGSAPFASARPAQSDADSKEIAAYRLTLDALAKVTNINRTMVQQMMKDPKLQESARINEELDGLSEKDELTEADEKRMEELSARMEQLEDVSNPLGGDAKSLSEMEARMKKYPPLMQALAREGMTAREYAKFWLAFIQAAFAHGFQKSGMLKELPPDVNKENVKFIAEHEAELQAMQKELEALGKKP